MICCATWAYANLYNVGGTSYIPVSGEGQHPRRIYPGEKCPVPFLCRPLLPCSRKVPLYDVDVASPLNGGHAQRLVESFRYCAASKSLVKFCCCACHCADCECYSLLPPASCRSPRPEARECDLLRQVRDGEANRLWLQQSVHSWSQAQHVLWLACILRSRNTAWWLVRRSCCWYVWHFN